MMMHIQFPKCYILKNCMIFSVQNSSHVYNNQPSPKTFTHSPFVLH